MGGMDSHTGRNPVALSNTLRSRGPPLCFNPGDTHPGSRRMLSLEAALGFRREGP